MGKDRNRKKRLRFRLIKATVPFAPPGTIESGPESFPTVARVLFFGPDSYTEKELTDPTAIGTERDDWPVTWIQVQGLGDAAFIRQLGEFLNLHPLALEDVLNTDQRSKSEAYPGFLFLVTRVPVDGEESETRQFSLFFGKGLVVTFEERPLPCFDPIRERVTQRQGLVRDKGADYLAYALLDVAVDAYFPILEQIGERLDQLEEKVLSGAERAVINEIHSIKGDLHSIRRTLWPQREAFHALIREPSRLFEKETAVYLRDLYDHLNRLGDFVESDREMCSDLMNLHLSIVNNGMNEVVQFLTMVSALFIPLSFLAGLYGMNFSTQSSPWNMPELEWTYGYPFVLSIMGLTALGILYYFKVKGWIGRSD